MTDGAIKPPKKDSPAAAAESSWLRFARSPVVLGILLAVVTAAVYLPVARNGFVDYDDSDYVTTNSHVLSGVTWANIKWAFVTGRASNWHPLTWISHMVDCQMFGPKAAGPHVVNVLFHVANTVLLFGVLRRMTGAVWRSAAVAALFALHPLHVESVAWVSERKDVLSTLFFLLTLWAYTKYAQENERRPCFILALGFFLLGLFSKPMLVTTPFVLLLLDYWPLGRGDGGVRRWAKLVWEKASFFVLAIASCVVTFRVQQKGGAVSTVLSLGERVANALVSYVRYIRKLFWPSDLSVLYPHPGHWPGTEVALCAVLLLAISVAVFVFGLKRRYLIVGWLWYLGTLVPVIGLVQVGIQSMADRYMYVPAIGLFVMLVWGAGDLIKADEFGELRLDAEAFAVGAGTVVTLALCGWLTVRQIGFWHDSEKLFRRAVKVTRDNYLAYNNLGFFLAGIGKHAEAMEYYQQSLKINASYTDALNNVGYEYARQKDYARAIQFYDRALRNQPENAEVHNNLGNALAELGHVDEAIAHYQITLRQKPDHANAHDNLGIAYAMKGRLDEAIQQFRLAIEYKPNEASAHSNLGNGLAAQRKFPEAVKEYQEAIRLSPNDAQAYNNLGNVLTEQGNLKEAVGQYQKALQLNPDNPEAEFNLALAFLRMNQREEAVKHLKEALRLKPDYANAKQQLGAMGELH